MAAQVVVRVVADVRRIQPTRLLVRPLVVEAQPVGAQPVGAQPVGVEDAVRVAAVALLLILTRRACRTRRLMSQVRSEKSRANAVLTQC